MSEFLMVVPDGWREIANPEQFTDEGSWRQMLPSDVTEILKHVALIAEDDSEQITDFRIFVDGDILRLWVVVAPHTVG